MLRFSIVTILFLAFNQVLGQDIKDSTSSKNTSEPVRIKQSIGIHSATSSAVNTTIHLGGVYDIYFRRNFKSSNIGSLRGHFGGYGDDSSLNSWYFKIGYNWSGNVLEKSKMKSSRLRHEIFLGAYVSNEVINSKKNNEINPPFSFTYGLKKEFNSGFSTHIGYSYPEGVYFNLLKTLYQLPKEQKESEKQKKQEKQEKIKIREDLTLRKNYFNLTVGLAFHGSLNYERYLSKSKGGKYYSYLETGIGGLGFWDGWATIPFRYTGLAQLKKSNKFFEFSAGIVGNIDVTGSGVDPIWPAGKIGIRKLLGKHTYIKYGVGMPEMFYLSFGF